MITEAFAYLRVSGTGQADGHGLDRQKEAIRVFCVQSKYVIREFYHDVHTGTADALDRPGFSEMVMVLNGVKTIIVERLDRLARSVIVQEHTIAWLMAHEIELIVADTGENVTDAYRGDPMKKAIVQMQAVFAEFDKSMIVKKLKAARDKLREKNGKCEGRKAYGEVDEGERAILGTIQNLRRYHGNTYELIAEALNDMGHTTRMGKPWTRGTVRNVMQVRVISRIGA